MYVHMYILYLFTVFQYSIISCIIKMCIFQYSILHVCARRYVSTSKLMWIAVQLISSGDRLYFMPWLLRKTILAGQANGTFFQFVV